MWILAFLAVAWADTPAVPAWAAATADCLAAHSGRVDQTVTAESTAECIAQGHPAEHCTGRGVIETAAAACVVRRLSSHEGRPIVSSISDAEKVYPATGLVYLVLEDPRSSPGTRANGWVIDAMTGTVLGRWQGPGGSIRYMGGERGLPYEDGL